MLEMAKKNKEILVLCILYGVVLLVVFNVFMGGNVYSSADGYYEIAKYLVSDAFFSRDGVNVNYDRTPGYPFFLAAIYFLGGSDITVIIIQILLTVISVYLFYRILVMWNTPKRLSLFGTILFLFYFQMLQSTFSIMSESLFSFFLMLSLYLLVVYFKNGKKPLIFLAFSMSLNYALLVRPILMYFNMLVCIALLAAFIVKKMHFKCFALFGLCFTVVFGGWSCRNYLHSGVFTFSTIQKINMQVYYPTIVTARINKISDAEFWDYVGGAALDYHNEMFFQEYPEAKDGNLNAAQIAILQGKYGSRFIRNNFPEFMKANIVGFMKMMLPPGFVPFDVSLVTRKPMLQHFLRVIFFMGLAYIIIIYFLYLLGLGVIFKKRDAVQICIFLLCGYLAIPGAILCTPRFRVPFFPLLLLSAVSTSGIIMRRLSQKFHVPVLERVEKYLLHDEETNI